MVKASVDVGISDSWSKLDAMGLESTLHQRRTPTNIGFVCVCFLSQSNRIGVLALFGGSGRKFSKVQLNGVFAAVLSRPRTTRKRLRQVSVPMQLRKKIPHHIGCPAKEPRTESQVEWALVFKNSSSRDEMQAAIIGRHESQVLRTQIIQASQGSHEL
jgi:hypothetical protein